jgi:hypothetical protein
MELGSAAPARPAGPAEVGEIRSGMMSMFPVHVIRITPGLADVRGASRSPTLQESRRSGNRRRPHVGAGHTPDFGD